MAAELATANLNADNHLLLEEPLLRVPLELLRKSHKSAQRNVERERETLLRDLSTAAETSNNAAASPQAKAHSLNAIDTMITRMETLKRKLSALHAEEEHLHKQSRARLDHVKALHSIPSAADVAYDTWSRTRLNRLLVDYLLRNGYDTSARNLAAANNLTDLVDIDESVAARRIERSLLSGRPNECLAWCAENKAALKKASSSLEMEIRLQEYIELLRSRERANMLKATRHAQKFLAPAGDTESAIHAAGLLAFPPNTLIEPYRSLYSPQRWRDLAEMFMRTHQSLLGLPHAPPLYVALTAGLSALKTPSCHSTHVSPSSALNATTNNNTAPSTSPSQEAQGVTAAPHAPPRIPSAIGHSVCPICSTELNALAKTVPFAHQTKSIVDSDLVVLPNGRVYGREKLMAFQAKVGGAGDGVVGLRSDADDGMMQGVEASVVRDPADQEYVVDAARLKRVYIS